IRLRVLGKSDACARGSDVTANRAPVDAERGGGLGLRAVEDVANHEGAEVRAAQGVPADEVTEARREEPPTLDGIPDRDRRVTVDIADAQERGDLAGRQP